MTDIRMPSFDITGKVAVITGGTKGIGRAISQTLSYFGADVVVSSRTEADCLAMAEEIESTGRRCLGVACDVSKTEDVDRLISKTIEAFDRLDILVNNAGVGGKTAPVLEQDEKDWDKVLGIDLKGIFLCSKAAARIMKEQGGGKIINIASVAGSIGQKNVSPYVAAKSGAIGLTRALANELARYNITVNAVCPGYIVTDINKDIITEPSVMNKIIPHCPVGHYGSVFDVAAPVAFLASDSCQYMTGTYFVVDGGFMTEAPYH